jgi:hypothetical protein
MYSTTDDGIADCLSLAASRAANDRRVRRRYPFFRPLTVTPHGAQGPLLPAFSRDISPGGIGLFHDAPLDRGRVVVTVAEKGDRPWEIPLEIRWCNAIGQDWHVSGGTFARSTRRTAAAFLMAAVKSEANRRLHQRFPFFTPITITTRGAQTFSAFSRDISWAGMGLLHRVPLDTGRIRLSIPRPQHDMLDLRLDIRWCKPVGAGWYTSGGEFVSLHLEELPALAG